MKGDISENKSSVAQLSTGGISNTVIDQINSNPDVKDAIDGQVKGQLDQFAKVSDVNQLIQNDGKGGILIGGDGTSPVTMGSVKVNGEVDASGNVVGGYLVATNPSSWSDCDALLSEDKYPFGSVYMGGGSSSVKDSHILGMCSSIHGKGIQHVFSPDGSGDAELAFQHQDAAFNTITGASITGTSITGSSSVTSPKMVLFKPNPDLTTQLPPQLTMSADKIADSVFQMGDGLGTMYIKGGALHSDGDLVTLGTLDYGKRIKCKDQITFNFSPNHYLLCDAS